MMRAVCTPAAPFVVEERTSEPYEMAPPQPGDIYTCVRHFNVFGVISSGRAVLMAMKTTIWRPNVRVTLDECGEVEDTESEGEELTKKGTKRKRAPPTKGPCEHGVKPRSRCKVCSACPHGKWRRLCKECGGSAICEHGRQRERERECGGLESASTVVGALSARSAVGLNLRARSFSLSVQGDGRRRYALRCERSECTNAVITHASTQSREH